MHEDGSTGAPHARSDDEPTSEACPPPDGRISARRRRLLTAAGALLALAVGTAVLAWPHRDPPPLADLPVDAWAPYWALEDSLPDLPDRAASLREISPFWFAATGAAVITVDRNVPRELADEFVRVARAEGLPLVPSIVDAMPAGGMAAVLSDPAQRAVHVDTIVSFAEQGDYDGIDLDYEQFAFADPRDTWAATRPHWVAFVAELAGRLHAQGRTLTVSIPPVYDADRTADSGYWVYDHGAIAEHVDRIRIMAYDFSTSSPGPIAPLDWVRRAIDGTVAATGDPEKLVLGIPLYGYNWPVGVAGTCPPDGDVGRTAITIRTVDDLVALRGATPLYDPVAGEWSATYDLVIEGDGADGAGRVSCTQRRQVQYVDAEGARLRIDLARAARLGGVALWAFGYDDATLWTAIAEIVRPPGR